MGKGDQDQGVRGRVIKHLRGLLLPMLGVGACTKETPPVVCDPMPPPSGSLIGDELPPDPNSTAAPPVVCDPMPAPPPSAMPSTAQPSREFAVPPPDPAPPTAVAPADPPPPPPPRVKTR